VPNFGLVVPYEIRITLLHNNRSRVRRWGKTVFKQCSDCTRAWCIFGSRYILNSSPVHNIILLYNYYWGKCYDNMTSYYIGCFNRNDFFLYTNEK